MNRRFFIAVLVMLGAFMPARAQSSETSTTSSTSTASQGQQSNGSAQKNYQTRQILSTTCPPSSSEMGCAPRSHEKFRLMDLLSIQALLRYLSLEN